MRFLIVVCVITFFSYPSIAAYNDPSSSLSENWISMSSPEVPATDGENIAVLAASEHRDITQKNLTAKYDGIKGGYETVTVTILPESDSDVQIISRYRILNNLIYAGTHPVYKTWISPDEEKQQKQAEYVAYSVAVNANGINSDKPLMYKDKMLSVTFDGKCDATVVEQNYAHEIVDVYHFDMCK